MVGVGLKGRCTSVRKCVAYRCCNKTPPTWWPETTHIYLFRIINFSSGGQKSKGGQQGWFLQASREDSVSCLLQLLETPAFLGSWALPASLKPAASHLPVSLTLSPSPMITPSASDEDSGDDTTCPADSPENPNCKGRVGTAGGHCSLRWEWSLLRVQGGAQSG